MRGLLILLRSVSQIIIPKRDVEIYQVYHIYSICCQRRNELQNYLIKNGVDAKVHYPIPMHLQPAAKDFGYLEGDFPHTEKLCKEVLSLPVHEFITNEQQEKVINLIRMRVSYKFLNTSLLRINCHILTFSETWTIIKFSIYTTNWI